LQLAYKEHHFDVSAIKMEMKKGAERGQAMIRSHKNRLMGDMSLPMGTIDPTLTTTERLLRWALMIGFLTVLSTEAWLLWQAWQHLF
jgi:hypothetical protein